MRIRGLLFIVLLLILASGTVYLLKGGQSTTPQTKQEIKPLFAGLPVNDVTAVEIKSSDRSVLIHKVDERWTVADRFDYPADYDRVANLLRGLHNAKSIRTFDGTDDTLSRLALKDLDASAQAGEKGTSVVLKDQKGQMIASALVGSERKADQSAAAGRYMRLGKDRKVYLAEGRYELYAANPLEWMDRRLLNIAPENIRQILCYSADTNELIFSLVSDAKGESLKPKDTKFNFGPDDIGLLSSSLTHLGAVDVFPADPEGKSNPDCAYSLEFVTFDDMVYRIYPSKTVGADSNEEHQIRIDVACITSSGNEECLRRANDLHVRFTPWIFKIDAYSYLRFVTSK